MTYPAVKYDYYRAPDKRCRRVIIFLFVFSTAMSCLINPRKVRSPEVISERNARISAASNLPMSNSWSPQRGSHRLNVVAPLPYLRSGNPANSFQALRQAVIAGAGFDFLVKVGDMMRDAADRSTKPGVIYNSRHKSGDAFDYNQEDSRVLLVREYISGRTYWRTYLLCEKQDGTLGVNADLHTDNVGRVSAYVFDFTAAAGRLGWERIAAKEGWGREPSKKEHWHYQMTEGLSFDRAVTLVKANSSSTAGGW